MSEATEQPVTAGKKPISEKQRLANIANSKLSTGPRTEAGKNISKWNGLRHGMRSEHDVIPGESQADFDELLAAHVEEYQPQGPLQELLVQRAVKAFQKLERGDRVEEALATKLVNAAAAQTPDGGGGGGSEGLDVSKLAEEFATDPAATARKVRKSLAGCRWVRDRLLAWRKRLETKPRLLGSQRKMSLYVLGKRMSDAYHDDPVATRWLIAHAGSVWGDKEEVPVDGFLAITGKPTPPLGENELNTRISELVEEIPSVQQSTLSLRALLAEELTRLDEHIELLTEVAERDRCLNIEAAQIPLTPEGKQLMTYVNGYRVSYEGALRRLDALQNPKRSRPGPAGGPGTPAPGQARATSRPPVAAAATMAEPDEPRDVAGAAAPSPSAAETIDAPPAAAKAMTEPEGDPGAAEPISGAGPMLASEPAEEATGPIGAAEPMVASQPALEANEPIWAAERDVMRGPALRMSEPLRTGGPAIRPEARPRPFATGPIEPGDPACNAEPDAAAKCLAERLAERAQQAARPGFPEHATMIKALLARVKAENGGLPPEDWADLQVERLNARAAIARAQALDGTAGRAPPNEGGGSANENREAVPGDAST